MSNSNLTRRQLLAGTVAMAAAGRLAMRAAHAADPPMHGGIEIVSSFDGGLLPPATIDGSTITFDLKGEVGIVNVLVRHDAFAPQWYPGKIFGISSLPNLAGGAPVLELKAKIPQNVYGSPILDRQGRVIGVYGEASPSQDLGVKDLHYATAVDSELLKSWTERKESDWVSPATIAGSSAGPERTTP